MARKTKKIKGVRSIMEKSKIKKLYEEVFKSVEQAVGMNIYCKEYATLDTIVVMNDDNELVRLDCYEYSFKEVFREIKKKLIKNNLFIIEMTVDKETLVIKTSNDIWGLMFVPEWDEENYFANELAEIKAEIEQEQQEEEAEATTWNEMYERELEEHKAEHTMVCPKCGGVAKNEAPNGAGVLEECGWYCTKCDWVMEDEEKLQLIEIE